MSQDHRSHLLHLSSEKERLLKQSRTKMSNREPTPYGLKSLLECMSRAVLLKQPDDIPGFLSKFMEEMIQFRGGDEARDIKEVAFDYGEQWGKF